MLFGRCQVGASVGCPSRSAVEAHCARLVEMAVHVVLPVSAAHHSLLRPFFSGLHGCCCHIQPWSRTIQWRVNIILETLSMTSSRSGAIRASSYGFESRADGLDAVASEDDPDD